MPTQDAPPGAQVLSAFGAREAPVRLAGGRGGSWRCGDLVLKPAEDPVALEWWAHALTRTTTSSGLRLASPARTASGTLVVEGWTAWRYLPGWHRPGRWREIIHAGRRFSHMFADVDPPGFLRARRDPWATADRVAWGEAEPTGEVPHLDRVHALCTDLDEPSRLIHGDLTGNVLFHPALPPAVIDPSLYWRPVEFGSAIVVVDAWTFEGASPSLAQALPPGPARAQHLLRALAFRLVADHELGVRRAPDDDPYTRVVERICRLARST